MGHIIKFCILGAEKSHGNHLKIITGYYKSNTFYFTLTLNNEKKTFIYICFVALL